MSGWRQRLPRVPAHSTALIIIGIVFAVFFVPVMLIDGQRIDSQDGMISVDLLLSTLPFELVACILIALIVALLGWRTPIGLRGRADRRGLWACLWVSVLPVSLLFVVAVAYVMNAPTDLALRMTSIILIFNLLVGYFEETLFRGVLLHGLRSRWGLWPAVIGSSAVFGLFHTVNYFAGQGLGITVYQVVNAVGLGLLFSAMRLQSGVLWPAILLHAVWNSYVMTAQVAMPYLLSETEAAAQSPQVTPTAFLIPLVVSILAVWLIRRWQRRTALSPQGAVSP